MSASPIYDRIEFLCKRKGINVTKMCADAGVTRGTLSDMKCGRQEGLSAAKASRIAEYLGVSVEYLLHGEEKTRLTETDEPCTANEVELLNLFRLLPAEDQRMILAMLEGVLKSKGLT